MLQFVRIFSSHIYFSHIGVTHSMFSVISKNMQTSYTVNYPFDNVTTNNNNNNNNNNSNLIQ
jgi:hypothetical protein